MFLEYKGNSTYVTLTPMKSGGHMLYVRIGIG